MDIFVSPKTPSFSFGWQGWHRLWRCMERRHVPWKSRACRKTSIQSLFHVSPSWCLPRVYVSQLVSWMSLSCIHRSNNLLGIRLGHSLVIHSVISQGWLLRSLGSKLIFQRHYFCSSYRKFSISFYRVLSYLESFHVHAIVSPGRFCIPLCSEKTWYKLNL